MGIFETVLNFANDNPGLASIIAGLALLVPIAGWLLRLFLRNPKIPDAPAPDHQSPSVSSTLHHSPSGLAVSGTTIQEGQIVGHQEIHHHGLGEKWIEIIFIII